MSVSENLKKVGLGIQVVWLVVMAIVAIVVGIGSLTGSVESTNSEPVEVVMTDEELYQNCMKSIEGYADDGGDRYANAAEACAMIGSGQ